MDDSKNAHQDNPANSRAKSPYLEEVAYLLSLLTPEVKKKFTDYLMTLRDSEDNQEPASAFQQKET